MTVYILTKTIFESWNYPQVHTNFKGAYGSIEKAWKAIEQDYYPLLKIIEELKYTIRNVRIDATGLAISYENFLDDHYYKETFYIETVEVQ